MGQKQHYVPQSYLRNFLIDKDSQLCIYKMEDGFTRTSPVNNTITSQDKFYQTYVPGLTEAKGENAVEEFFAKNIEPRASEFDFYTNSLIKGERRILDIKNQFITYLYFQHTRTRFLDLHPGRRRNDSDKEKHIRFMLNEESMKAFARNLLASKWIIFLADVDHPAFCTDNPVIPAVLFGSDIKRIRDILTENQYRHNLEGYENNYLFPMSKKFILAAVSPNHPEFRSIEDGITLNMNDAIYKFIASQIISGADEYLILSSTEDLKTVQRLINFNEIKLFKEAGRIESNALDNNRGK